MNWKVLGFVIVLALGIGFLTEFYFMEVLTPLGTLVDTFRFADWLTKQDNIWVICGASLLFIFMMNLPKYLKEKFLEGKS